MNPGAKHGCRGCMTLKEKTCPACLLPLPRSAFYTRANGHTINPCKECAKKKRRTWVAEHLAEEAAYKLRYREPRRELEAEQARVYASGHKKERAARVRLKRQTDPRFAIENALRRSLADAVRLALAKKAGKTFDLLGCTMPEFMAHIERQWVAGMSWENWGAGRGKWNLDHIRPLASFDLCDPDEQRACFHWSNFQPLWAIENIRKRDKLVGAFPAAPVPSRSCVSPAPCR